MRAKTVTLFIALILASIGTNGQPFQRTQPGLMPSKIYYEANVFPNTDTTQLLITFRIPHDRLVFFKNREVSENNNYVSTVKITAELYQGLEKVAEKSWKTEHFVASFEDTQDKNQDLQGQLVFDVEPGRYAYRLLIDDQHTEGEAQSTLKMVQVPDFSKTALSQPFFVVKPRETTLQLVNLGGDIPYTSETTANIIFTLASDESLADAKIRYELFKVDNAKIRRQQEQVRQNMRGSRGRRNQTTSSEQLRAAERTMEVEKEMEHFLRDAQLAKSGDVAMEEIALFDYEFNSKTPSQIRLNAGIGNAYLAQFTFESENLSNGVYILKISLETPQVKEQTQVRFATHWRDMPTTLLNIDTAIDYLQFIEEKGTVRELKRKDESEKEQAFLTYWKDKDPTPETEANELMTEYYRRIEYAQKNFSVQGTPQNILESDKAKVYVLNGTPGKIERELPSRGGVREVWTYRNGKQYVFEASSSLDNYYLVESF